MSALADSTLGELGKMGAATAGKQTSVKEMTMRISTGPTLPNAL
jgi:hypothetical protein